MATRKIVVETWPAGTAQNAKWNGRGPSPRVRRWLARSYIAPILVGVIGFVVFFAVFSGVFFLIQDIAFGLIALIRG